ncbi:MAG: VOC family protein [Microbacteriaceae bacterium]
MPQFTTVAHIDLSVSDLEKSAAWYRDVLGLRQLHRADKGSYSTVVLRHDDTGLIVGLNQHNAMIADRFNERNVGLDHIGFAVVDRGELDLWELRLTELGVEHSPVTDSPSGSGTALVFRDPDNIQLEFWWTRQP